jgi:hypothetical protein
MVCIAGASHGGRTPAASGSRIASPAAMRIAGAMTTKNATTSATSGIPCCQRATLLEIRCPDCERPCIDRVKNG